MTKKIILTSFPPFHTHPYNPSEHVYENLQLDQIQSHIDHQVLTVDYQNSFEQLKKRILTEQPQFIFMMGLAASRRDITLERIGINYIHSERVDNLGNIVKKQRILRDGPDGLMTTLPIDDILEELIHRKLPFSVSNTAGTYVCNYIFYQTLNLLRDENLSSHAEFVHLPPTQELDQQSSMNIQELGRHITELLRVSEKY